MSTKLPCESPSATGAEVDPPSDLSSKPVTQDKEEDGSTRENTQDSRIKQDALHSYPLTKEQIEHSIQEFIDSIDKEAVCALASKHNGGKPCRITDQQHGSFNICFFILFPDENVSWVLRIPLEPVVCNPWIKVVSEVTTTRYIKSNTAIPVPEIHVYGQDTTLVEGCSTPFMLMDLMPGKQLHTNAVFQASESQRRNLYIDLIDILAQLRKLEFPAAGSLMPNPENPDLDPIMGPFLSITINEFERQRREPVSTEVFTSVERFVNLHHRILLETLQMPTVELGAKQAKMELFALDSLSQEITTRAELQDSNRPFILAHTDLRCGNIIVDDDFHIVGIIDWEFASAIPQAFFTPPPWITGHDPDTIYIVTGVLPGEILREFSIVLEEMHEIKGWTQLWQDWGFQQNRATLSEKLLLEIPPIVQILRHPTTMANVYYSSIFKRLFGSDTCKDAVVDAFFEEDCNQDLAGEIDVQIQKSERYTTYLKDNNLFIPNERSQIIQDWLDLANEALKSAKTKRPESLDD